MNNRMYAMEAGFLTQLLTDRKELLQIARSFKTAEEMRLAKADLMKSITSINITPKNREQLENSYVIDSEGTAHIPIVGELTPHAETDICGAYTANALTEYGFITAATEAADKDDRVERIQFNINSPGGYVDGLMAAVDAIRSAEKNTLAFVDGMAASAAYWLASQADSIVASSPASRVGSIGVAIETFDDTKALENMGFERIILTSTDAPLKRPDIRTEEGQDQIVSSLDDMHNVFVQYVAEGRGVDPGEVAEKYGQGAVLIAENALQSGMIDSIEKVPARRAETILDVVQTDTVVKAGEIKQEVKMENLDELKKEYPGLFAKAVDIGIAQERERVTELRTYIDADPDNTKLAEVINTAIAGGQIATEISAKVQVAIRDGGKLAGENAPEVETAETIDSALSEEDTAAAKEAGMTIEEYKKAQAYLDKEGK